MKLIRLWRVGPKDIFEIASTLYQAMGDGLHRCPSSMATRPHPPQTNFIAASLSLHTWVGSLAGSPQKLHFALSPQGLHRCPGASATAPQDLHV